MMPVPTISQSFKLIFSPPQTRIFSHIHGENDMLPILRQNVLLSPHFLGSQIFFTEYI